MVTPKVWPAAALLLLCGGTAQAQSLVHLDDRFAQAVIRAPAAPAALRLSEPLVWEFDTEAITWRAARGRIGFKPGQLVLKGDNASPVIVAPSNPPIDWSRFKTLVVRMVTEGGSEIRLKIGELETKQPLGPAMQWGTYKFELPPGDSSYTRPVAVMPTDDPNATAVIDTIYLIPRESQFKKPAGVTNLGKREEYRNVVYTRVPGSVTYRLTPPKDSMLRFGFGLGSDGPVTFRVFAGNDSKELYSAVLADPAIWQDAEVDLKPYAGMLTKLELKVESASNPEAVGLWANPVVTPATSNRLNVLLYVVCTLRPDHTSLYGYARETTPFLKRLGQSSVVFDDAVSQAPWTKPSVSSLMTSLHAYTHGLAADTDTIPANATTLAAQLRKAGYVTASIVANPFAGRMSGLERGFDYMMEYPVVQRNRTEAVDRGTDSAAINRAISPWLQQHRAEPFFLYVQSTDPHAPYRPPAEFESKWADSSQSRLFDNEYGALRDIRAYGGGATVTRQEVLAKGIDPDVYARQAIDRYDGEIAHNDKSFETLVDGIRRLGLLGNTLIIVASDHGEEFWEHGYGAHGHSLYSELIRAALLIRHPAQIGNARRIAEPVQLIDVMPTILDIVGAPIPPGLQGQSLAPLLAGRSFTRRTPILSSRLALPRAKPGGGVPENLTGTIAHIDKDWKLIFRTDPKRANLKEVELYDRHRDPGDKTDVSSANPQVTARLTAEVKRWLESQKLVKQQLGATGKSKLDSQNVERLKSLGYIGSKEK